MLPGGSGGRGVRQRICVCGGSNPSSSNQRRCHRGAISGTGGVCVATRGRERRGELADGADELQAVPSWHAQVVKELLGVGIELDHEVVRVVALEGREDDGIATKIRPARLL